MIENRKAVFPEGDTDSAIVDCGLEDQPYSDLKYPPLVESIRNLTEAGRRQIPFGLIKLGSIGYIISFDSELEPVFPLISKHPVTT